MMEFQETAWARWPSEDWVSSGEESHLHPNSGWPSQTPHAEEKNRKRCSARQEVDQSDLFCQKADAGPAPFSPLTGPHKSDHYLISRTIRLFEWIWSGYQIMQRSDYHTWTFSQCSDIMQMWKKSKKKKKARVHVFKITGSHYICMQQMDWSVQTVVFRLLLHSSDYYLKDFLSQCGKIT